MNKDKETLNKLIAFMVRQAHHERNQPLTVRPELVEGLVQRLRKLKIGLFFGLCCYIAAVIKPCQAEEPPIEPIMRVETDMHTAFIKKLSVDRINNKVVSVSDDKTVRVWDLKTGRLLDTFRIPIMPKGHEGELQVAAVSPDGRTVAVGGNTGLGWSRHKQNSTIYFFGLDNGLMKAVPLPNIPMVVENLAYSDDGRFLAICLSTSKRSALLIYDMADNKFIKIIDDVYKDRIYGIDFSADGRLVITSVDGYVRLYNNAFDLIQEKHLGNRPFHAYFSPDGSEIAIGFDDIARVEILSGADLSEQYKPDIDRLADQLNLIAVAWSPTGDFLYAGGEYSGSGDTPIYFWDKKGRGKRGRFNTRSTYRVSDLHTLQNGNVVFSTGEPSIGLADAEGKQIWLRNSDTVNYREGYKAFCVSHDGSQVEYLLRTGEKQIVQFLPPDKYVQTSGETCTLTPPIQVAANLSVENWKNSEHPRLNGKAIAGLENHESSQSYAISPDEKHLLIGTSWSLRLYGSKGILQWKQPLSQMVWAVNISGNGRLALAALSDGTIRWYRMADGIELFAYFPFNGKTKINGESNNEPDWVAWTPYGYYNSSERGDEYIGWHLNQGKDKPAEFFRAVQFERMLYKPQKVAEYFFCITDQSAKFACQSSAPSNYQQLTENKPPAISALSVEANEPKESHANAMLQFSAEKTGLPMEDYTVFVNNIPITPTLERNLTGKEVDAFSRLVPIEFYKEDNVIRVEVSNGKSIGVQERFYRVSETSKSEASPTGNLYLLAVGVNSFPKLDKTWQLRYAALDADAIGQIFREYGEGTYQEIYTRILSDNQATKPDKAQVLESLKFIQSAQANDTVIVFLSSHGISDPQQNYYFVPKDADNAEVQQILQGQSDSPASVIGWETFFEVLSATAGKRILIVDTCKAKSIGGRFDAKWLKKHSSSAHFASLVSSKGTEQSLEDSKLGHGLFTEALLKGIVSGCEGRCNGPITLNGLFDYSEQRLKENARGNGSDQQTPELSGSDEIRKSVIINRKFDAGIGYTIEQWTRFLYGLWSKFLNFMKLEWV